MVMSRVPRTAGAVLSAALLLAACTDDGAPAVEDGAASPPSAEQTVEPDASPEQPPAPTEAASSEPTHGATPEPSPVPEPAPEATQEQAQPSQPETAGPCDDREARGHDVTAVNFAFSEDAITEVCSGDTVTLTVEEGSHSFTVNGAAGDTGVFGSGESRTTTVSGAPGTYTFRCTLHPNQMSGQIELIG